MYTIPARFADEDRSIIEDWARFRGVSVAELLRLALAQYTGYNLADVSRWPKNGSENSPQTRVKTP